MKFLVAVDGSTEAEEALDCAINVADEMGASVTAIHAIGPEIFDEGGDEPVSFRDASGRLVQESLDDAEQRGFDVVEDAAAHAAEAGQAVDTDVVYGDPPIAISEHAEREEFDAIFVGHRGRNPRAELMLGSVAKGLVERASVPVTVVR